MRKLLFVFLLPCVLFAKERAVSLSPTVTELILSVGGKTLICGRSSVCDAPAVRNIPIAGDLGKPFAEKVLALKASVIITDVEHPQAQWELLRRCGVKIELLSGKNLDDMVENLRRIGKVLNLPEAENKAEQIAEKIGDLRKNPPALRKKAVILFSVAPLISCGKASFITEALSLAGVENPAAQNSKNYFYLSAEELFRINPDIIFIAGVPEKTVREYFANKAFQNLDALKNDRLVILDENKWCRLTPELIEAVLDLRKSLSSER